MTILTRAVSELQRMSKAPGLSGTDCDFLDNLAGRAGRRTGLWRFPYREMIPRLIEVYTPLAITERLKQ